MVIATDDGEIADIAAREGYYVRALKSSAQLREGFERLDRAGDALPFSRCLHCNAPLHVIDKACMLDRLPPSVRMTQDAFSTCDLWRRVYWQGSHWQHMKALMRESGVVD